MFDDPKKKKALLTFVATSILLAWNIFGSIGATEAPSSALQTLTIILDICLAIGAIVSLVTLFKAE